MHTKDGQRMEDYITYTLSIPNQETDSDAIIINYNLCIVIGDWTRMAYKKTFEPVLIKIFLYFLKDKTPAKHH